MEKTNILITSAGRRVSLVNSFKEEVKSLGLFSRIYCTDLNPILSSACQVADGFFKVKKVTDIEYINDLLDICIENNIRIVIPTIDTELETLAKNVELFSKNGIIVLISNLEFIQKCRDKRLIHDFFDSIEFKRAQEYNIKKLKYPSFVKPSDGSRSQGIYLIESKNDLTQEILENNKNMFLEYLPSDNYVEFTIDIYFTKHSKIKCIVPRERIIVRDGEVNTACTRNNSIVLYVKEKLKNLNGLRGCITLQVFKHNDKDEIIGIEINPRFGGGYPLSYNSGANFPKWIIEEYILDRFEDDYFDDWIENLLMIRYDQEIIVNGYKG
ncbi:ATP-grasp domain-containing protein [uncultured Tenacibaculum sp.]|uniref:ATP-grasp domain-containing protein n=1 Tax=uncultured Tenacibaculum sp. TaxID=174713 RepID=UPI00261B0C10|nr:ATP-grasp domain-containing protein [uncultured Tenacibaculum sp.]